MKQDKETRNKLLESARAEFLEKGYMKASLRTICKNAGLTTGALYFFFKDKDDLFCSLVKDAIEGIRGVMLMHYKEERQHVENVDMSEEIMDDGSDDLEAAIQAIHQMYQYRNDVLLVLTKSQGSSMENIFDQFVEESEEHIQTIAKEIQRQRPEIVIDHNYIHWLAHMQIDAFVYMITHIENEIEAIRYMAQAVTFMIEGWNGMLTKKITPT